MLSIGNINGYQAKKTKRVHPKAQKLAPPAKRMRGSFSFNNVGNYQNNVGNYQATRFPPGFPFNSTGFHVGDFGNIQVNNQQRNGSMNISTGSCITTMNGLEVECSSAPDGSRRVLVDGVEVFNTGRSNYVAESGWSGSNVQCINGSSCMIVNGLKVESFRGPNGSSRITVNGVEVFNTGSSNNVRRPRRVRRAITSYVAESGLSGSRDPESPNPAVQPMTSPNSTIFLPEVERAMGSAMVATAMEVGFSQNLIRRVVQRQLEMNGVLLNDTTALIDYLLAEPKATSDDGVLLNDTTALIDDLLEEPIATSDDVMNGVLLNDTTALIDNLLEEPKATIILPDLEGAMGSSMVATAMEAGFSQNLIRRVLQRQFEMNGALLNDTTALIDDLLEEPKATTDDVKKDDENDKGVCKVCLDNEVQVLFVPCGHTVCCEDCGDFLNTCPICREVITDTIRAYLS